MSQVLEIKNDAYLSFCIDETSEYVYNKWKDKIKNEAELKTMMDKHSKKRQ